MNPIIYEDQVRELWDKASFNEAGADWTGAVESTVKGEKIIVSKQTIREVLRFGDQSELLTEIFATQIGEVLKRMGYGGTFPPTLKKLLPPY